MAETGHVLCCDFCCLLCVAMEACSRSFLGGWGGNLKGSRNHKFIKDPCFCKCGLGLVDAEREGATMRLAC